MTTVTYLATSSRQPLWRRLGVLGLTLVGAALVGLFLLSYFDTRQRERRFEEVLQSLRKSAYAPGTHRVELPSPLKQASWDGTVSLRVTDDGRYIVLFKEKVGWKMNYSGSVYSDAPLRAEDFESNGVRRAVSCFGDSEFPFVSSQFNSRWYLVFFDLG